MGVKKKSSLIFCVSFALSFSLTQNVQAQENTSSIVNEQGARYHEVQKGENLWTIAREYFGDGDKWPQIAEANNLVNPRLIHSGNKLLIPSPSISENLISNGNFESEDFGYIENWSYTNIETGKWYLVNKESSEGVKRAELVNFVNIGVKDEGHGMLSTDTMVCDYFCSSEALQIVQARENTTYTLSADTLTLEGTKGSLYLDFLGKDKNRIQVKTVGGNSNGDWAQTQTTATSPTGTKYIRVILYISNQSTGKLLWDNIKLLEEN